MHSESEVEEVRRHLEDAKNRVKAVRERLNEYKLNKPGEYGATYQTLIEVVDSSNRVVIETKLLLNVLEMRYSKPIFAGIPRSI